jgi:3-oxoacyl-[acyl-carrier-protein] synthase-3
MGCGVRIAGWGKHLPSRVLTNVDLTGIVDTSDAWIVARTGIRERRRAADSEGTASMALAAARGALARAGADGGGVELIIVATVSPDYQFPAVACLVQAALGARAAAFDLQAGCAGFATALATAAQYLRAGVYARALVVGSDTVSRLVDWGDRDTCVLFGDGAGAVYLEAVDGPGDLRGIELGADGSCPDALFMDGPARPLAASDAPCADGLPVAVGRSTRVRMDGRQVFRFAAQALADGVARAAGAAGWRPDEVDLVVPHQANLRIIQAAGRALGLPDGRFYTNLEHYGNTTNAALPIALCEALDGGRVRPGDRLVLAAFGAGLAWAALAFEWPGARQAA